MLKKIKGNKENIRKVLVTFVDQSMLSATSFTINALLATYLLKEDYALYAIALSINALLLGLQNALITTPLTVQAPAAKFTRIKTAFSSGLLFYQFILLILFILFCFFLKFINSAAAFNKQYLFIMPIIGVSSFGILLREFLRHYYFVDIKPKMVLLLDFSYVFIIILVILILRPDVKTTLIFMGLTSAVVSIVFTTKFDKHLLAYSLKKIRYAIKKSWIYSRWSLLGVIITWLQANSYIYMLESMRSSSHVADAAFSNLLLMPTTLFIVSWGRFFKPKSVYILQQDKDPRRLFDITLVTSMLLFTGVGIYATLLYFFVPILNDVWLQGKYLFLEQYIILWSGVFALRAIRTNFSMLLQVLYEFKNLTFILLFSSIATVLASYFMIAEFGTYGGIFSIIFGESILTIGTFLSLKKIVLARTAATSNISSWQTGSPQGHRVLKQSQ